MNTRVLAHLPHHGDGLRPMIDFTVLTHPRSFVQLRIVVAPTTIRKDGFRRLFPFRVIRIIRLAIHVDVLS